MHSNAITSRVALYDYCVLQPLLAPRLAVEVGAGDDEVVWGGEGGRGVRVMLEGGEDAPNSVG